MAGKGFNEHASALNPKEIGISERASIWDVRRESRGVECAGKQKCCSNLDGVAGKGFGWQPNESHNGFSRADEKLDMSAKLRNFLRGHTPV